jgi:hypothetical protein
MDEVKFARWGLLAGLGAAVLLVVSGLIAGEPPKLSDADPKILEFLTDKQDSLKIASYLGGLAGLLLLWFLGSLYGKIRAAEGGNGRLARVAMMGGVATIAVAFAGNAMAANAALRPNPDFWRLSYQFYAYTGFAAAVFTAAVAVLIWNTGLLPKWLGYAGEVVAVAWLVGAAGVSTENDTIGLIGFLVFLAWSIWVAVLSVLLYRKAD